MTSSRARDDSAAAAAGRGDRPRLGRPAAHGRVRRTKPASSWSRWPGWRPTSSAALGDEYGIAEDYRFADWQDLVAHGGARRRQHRHPDHPARPDRDRGAGRRSARAVGEADGRERGEGPHHGGGGPAQRPGARHLLQPPPPRRRPGAEEDHRRRPARSHLLRQGRLAAPRGHPGPRQLVHPRRHRRRRAADGHRRAHARHGAAPARRAGGDGRHRGHVRRVRAARQGRLRRTGRSRRARAPTTSSTSRTCRPRSCGWATAARCCWSRAGRSGSRTTSATSRCTAPTAGPTSSGAATPARVPPAEHLDREGRGPRAAPADHSAGRRARRGRHRLRQPGALRRDQGPRRDARRWSGPSSSTPATPRPARAGRSDWIDDSRPNDRQQGAT